jgi:DNA-binding FrmR family transcriptional regulator
MATVPARGIICLMHGDQQALLNRLRRIEGQVRGVQRMVEEDAYCIDILTQLAAVRTALEQVAVRVLDGHVRGCVTDAVAAGDEQAEERLDELMAAVERFARVR